MSRDHQIRRLLDKLSLARRHQAYWDDEAVRRIANGDSESISIGWAINDLKFWVGIECWATYELSRLGYEEDLS